MGDNTSMKKVEQIIEAIRRLNGQQLDELAELLAQDGLGDKISFLVEVHNREKDNEL